jgi:hypothetical protein
MTNNFFANKNKYNRSSLSLILMILIVALGIVSCTKNFTTINTTSSGSPVATLPQLFVAFVANIDNTANSEQRDDNGWVYPITQQGMIYTKSDYSYAATSAWSDFYHNLSNYNAAMNLIAASPDTTIYTNVKGMLKTLKVYQAIKVSNFYGDMPYSDAGKAIYYGTASYTPKYDKQQSIYLSCLSDLTWAVNNFDASANSKQFSLGNSDGVLLNNITQWIKFANSLRLRIALTMYGKDPTDAAPIIADALTKPLLSDYTIDNIGLYAANISGLGFPARAYSFGTECRLRMGTTMWQMMSSNNNLDGSGIFDPRCNIFFEPNNDTQWNPFPQNPTTSTPAEQGDPYNTSIRDADWANKDGAPAPGTPNLYANFNYYWSRDGVATGSIGTIPELFMTAAEVHFLKAEAYAIGVAGVAQNLTTAQTEYNAGITASVNFWTTMAINSDVWVVNKPAGLPSDAVIDTLLSNPVVLFNPATALQQIYAQEWIDMIRQPWDAWTLLRRTGGLTPMDPNNAAYYTQTYGGYQRYRYPDSESEYNRANWQAATGGSDLISTKIWIAK